MLKKRLTKYAMLYIADTMEVLEEGSVGTEYEVVYNSVADFIERENVTFEYYEDDSHVSIDYAILNVYINGNLDMTFKCSMFI